LLNATLLDVYYRVFCHDLPPGRLYETTPQRALIIEAVRDFIRRIVFDAPRKIGCHVGDYDSQADNQQEEEGD
jgi:23S rRNA A1618 N6-methylase RlmF